MNTLCRYAFLLATCGCLGSGATAENTDTFALLRVDGISVPTSVNDASGSSVLVTGGNITTYGSSVDFRYEIDLANGKSLTGVKDRLSDLTIANGGVQMVADLVTVGGPAGPHTYLYQASDAKTCDCGRLCDRPCATDRVADTTRIALAHSAESLRLAEYKTRLSPLVPVVQRQ